MPMDSACGNAALPALGFPIRESADHRLFSASPRLIAAVHALLRLLVPRHPPPALTILTVITPAGSADAVIPVHWLHCAVFKVRGEAFACGADAAAPMSPRTAAPADAGLSKLDSMRAPRESAPEARSGA